jgi:hypothetical protein
MSNGLRDYSISVNLLLIKFFFFVSVKFIRPYRASKYGAVFLNSAIHLLTSTVLCTVTTCNPFSTTHIKFLFWWNLVYPERENAGFCLEKLGEGNSLFWAHTALMNCFFLWRRMLYSNVNVKPEQNTVLPTFSLYLFCYSDSLLQGRHLVRFVSL